MVNGSRRKWQCSCGGPGWLLLRVRLEGYGQGYTSERAFERKGGQCFCSLLSLLPAIHQAESCKVFYKFNNIFPSTFEVCVIVQNQNQTIATKISKCFHVFSFWRLIRLCVPLKSFNRYDLFVFNIYLFIYLIFLPLIPE